MAGRLTPREKFGKRLAAIRRKAGLTQGQVSRRLGYSCPQFVSNWERGISYPPDDTFGPLARVLKVEPETVVDLAFTARRMELGEQQRALRAAARGA